MMIQSTMQFSNDQDTKKKKEEEKKLDILGMVKKIRNGFMIRRSGMLMQWMLDWWIYGLKIHYNTTT